MSRDRRLYMSLSPSLNKLGDSVFSRGMVRAESDSQSTSRISRRKFPLNLISTHVFGLQNADRAANGRRRAEDRSIHVTIQPRKFA